MAEVIITLKIMPESPEVNLKKVFEKVREHVNKFGEIGKVVEEPIAFGLKSLKIFFIAPESKGNPEDELIPLIQKVEGVANSEIIDVRRTLE
ncbi:MAG: elongation factor 1-beta [Nanoarchaeota archaeon]|nr:elongation factor 1-beta [Nanoarchaeota archaeon]